jgi:hypothetical protein
MSNFEALGLDNGDQALGYLISEIRHLKEAATARDESLRRVEEAWRLHDAQESQRVHALEARFAAMEARQITKADVDKIWSVLSSLEKSTHASSGARAFGAGLSAQLAAWLAILVALGLAVANRFEIKHAHPSAPAAIEQNR